MIPTCVIPQDLSVSASPQFVGLKLTGLQPNQAVLTDSNNNLVSADWLNQAVKTNSSPFFSAVGFQTSIGNYVLRTCSFQNGLAVVPSVSEGNIFRVYSKDGDGTKPVGFHVLSKGTVDSVANSERFFMGWAPRLNSYLIQSVITGSGMTQRPIRIGTHNYNNQLYIEPNGRIGILNSAPEYTLDVNGSIRASGEIIGASLSAQNGATGTFQDKNDRIIEVQNGIITYIETA